MTPTAITVCALAIAAGIIAAELRAYALSVEHADCGENCDLAGTVLTGPWST